MISCTLKEPNVGCDDKYKENVFIPSTNRASATLYYCYGIPF